MRPRPLLRAVGLVGIVVVASVALAASGVVHLAGPYDHDSGGWGDSGNLAAYGLVARASAAGPDFETVLHEGDALIEHALPTAVDLSEKANLPGGVFGPGEIVFSWTPAGQRDTQMPPNPRGERVYSVEVLLNRYLAGDPLARISFISRADAAKLGAPASLSDLTSLSPGDSSPSIYAYVYRIDKATVQKLIDLIYQHT